MDVLLSPPMLVVLGCVYLTLVLHGIRPHNATLVRGGITALLMGLATWLLV